MIHMIVAMSKNNIIGQNNQLPRPHLAGDMAQFRKKITDQIIIMGSNTAQSFRTHPKLIHNAIAQQGGHPLAHTSIIMTRNINPQKPYTDPATGKQVICTNASVKDLCQIYHGQDIRIVGGAMIYAAWLPYTETLHMTRIEEEYAGDTVFPTDYKQYFANESTQPGPDPNTTTILYTK